MNQFKTEWTHNPIELTKEQQKILDWEIADIGDELEVASDLIFHTVFISDDLDGPIIIVDGRDGVDDTLFLTYYENPQWVNVNDVENLPKS